MEYQPNQMKNTNPFCIVFEVLKVLLIIIATTRSFISCCCMLDFTSAQVAYPCLIKYRDVPNSVTKFYSQIADKNLWPLFFRYCSVKRMPGPFCQANSVAGNTCSGRTNGTFVKSPLLYNYCCCAVDCIFKTMYFKVIYKYQ